MLAAVPTEPIVQEMAALLAAILPQLHRALPAARLPMVEIIRMLLRLPLPADRADLRAVVPVPPMAVDPVGLEAKAAAVPVDLAVVDLAAPGVPVAEEEAVVDLAVAASEAAPNGTSPFSSRPQLRR
jgi:hypothetical protein